MTDTPLDNLKSLLRDATTWSESSTQLWKRALADRSSISKTRSSFLAFDVIEFVRRRWFPLTVSASAACLAFALFLTSRVGSTPFIFPGFEAKTETQKSFASPSPAAQPPSADTTKLYDFSNQKNLSYSYQYQASASTPPQEAAGEPTFPLMADENPYVKRQVASPASDSRHVIHKATIELTTPDVRAAFLKAGLVLNEALGEHVQDSSLTGTGNDATGTLTLRVVASRLSKVLNELRELGVVVSERQEGQDVTGQVVDIEARLRNEQRVEKELLELFDQRKDAPLKDVLDLSQKLSEVRSGIEQLVAQRDHLSRLVSLATVLVIIRTGEKPVEEPKDQGLSHYFSESIKHAWRTGTRGLADTVAALVSILIGGLIWWILLIVALLLLRRYVRGRKS